MIYKSIPPRVGGSGGVGPVGPAGPAGPPGADGTNGAAGTTTVIAQAAVDATQTAVIADNTDRLASLTLWLLNEGFQNIPDNLLDLLDTNPSV